MVELAARQHNRFSRVQLLGLGFDDVAIHRRVASGRWIAVHDAVYAVAPVLSDDVGRWIAATLTDAGSVLSHASAAAAWGFWDRPRAFEAVTRPGNGGPRRYDGLVVHRSETITDDATVHLGIPITTVPRALLDLAPHVGLRLLGRSTREAIRLGMTTAADIVEALATRHRGRRGSRRLTLVVGRYTVLPIERCRSCAEVRALEVLRDAGRPAPGVNRSISGEEADLSWPAHRRIIEIDGPQFHLDIGEDVRKQQRWERAGWEVRRLPSPDVFDRPDRLLAVAPTSERP